MAKGGVWMLVDGPSTGQGGRAGDRHNQLTVLQVTHVKSPDLVPRLASSRQMSGIIRAEVPNSYPC